jgi:hypothetical protein
MSRKKIIDDNDIAIMIQGQNEAHKKRNDEYLKDVRDTKLLKYMNTYKKKNGLKRGDKILSEISKKIKDDSIKTESDIDKYFKKESIKTKIETLINEIKNKK